MNLLCQELKIKVSCIAVVVQDNVLLTVYYLWKFPPWLECQAGDLSLNSLLPPHVRKHWGIGAWWKKGILNMNPRLRLSREVANVNAIMLMHVVG